MRIQDIEGAFGLVGVHPEDEALHAALSMELGQQGRPPATLLHRLENSGRRWGELGLARALAAQALEQNVSVLVTPALRDHPDHDAAAFIGRQAAAMAGVGLLELLPYGLPQNGRPSSGPRSADQPLTFQDISPPPRLLTHQQPLGAAAYLWTPLPQAPQLPVVVGVP